jgi:hypothetical protein
LLSTKNLDALNFLLRSKCPFLHTLHLVDRALLFHR